MCLILFAVQPNPDYRLVVAANRDEFYRRPAHPAGLWDDYPEILAGRDAEIAAIKAALETTTERLRLFREEESPRLEKKIMAKLAKKFPALGESKNEDEAA